jgi:hypothetical protein
MQGLKLIFIAFLVTASLHRKINFNKCLVLYLKIILYCAYVSWLDHIPAATKEFLEEGKSLLFRANESVFAVPGDNCI